MTAATKDQGTRHQITTPSDREIRIERTFNAPRAKVWRAFTDPEWLAQWWGRGNKLDIERYEFQRGGHYRFVEHNDKGKDGFEGRFMEIAPPERLMLTFEWDGLPGYSIREEITLEDQGERTRVVTTMWFLKTEERDGMLHSGMEGGMAESYAALDRLLASK